MYKVALLTLLCAFSSLSQGAFASPLEGGRVMLMARRNIMAGAKMPWDYRVEYLDCSNQYGNHDLKYRFNTLVDSASVYSGWIKAFFSNIRGKQTEGQRLLSTTNEAPWRITISAWSGTAYGNAGYYLLGGTMISGRFSGRGLYEFEFDQTTYKVNGVAYPISPTKARPAISGTPIALMAFLDNAVDAFSGLFYGAKFYDKDGNIIFNGVPCVKDGTGCIYDTVGKRFVFNTESFVVPTGPRV